MTVAQFKPIESRLGASFPLTDETAAMRSKIISETESFNAYGASLQAEETELAKTPPRDWTDAHMRAADRFKRRKTEQARQRVGLLESTMECLRRMMQTDFTAARQTLSDQLEAAQAKATEYLVAGGWTAEAITPAALLCNGNVRRCHEDLCAMDLLTLRDARDRTEADLKTADAMLEAVKEKALAV